MAVAAYSALLSLADGLNNVQHPARRHRLHLDVDRIQSLQEKVQFLQDFLEVHSQRKIQELEDLAGQITVVADDVEDIIDLHVVYQLHEESQNESHHLQVTPSSFCEDIDKVIIKIDSITKELMMIKEDWGNDVQEQKAIPLQPASSSTGLPSTGKDSTVVGFDERLLHIIDELTKDESNLRILPIVGMGGIGIREIGKGITKACRGLPLAIVAIAGLLANSNMQQQYWEFIAKNVNSFANSQDNDHCLKVLSLSYNYLPLHLKACFLYTSTFPEDARIKVSELVRIWIGEGFVKSVRGQLLEETANRYLEDLVARNLILIGERTVCGKIRSCSIHDLLRDLCLREFDKEHFVRNLKVRWDNRTEWWWNNRWGSLSGTMCFLCCKSEKEKVNIDLPLVFVGTRSTSVASIWICNYCKIKYPNLAKLRLARVMDDFAGDEMLELTKLRCLFLHGFSYYSFQSSSLHLLWNLKSLLVDFSDSPNNPSVLPNEIWEMPQLRHLKFRNALLPDPTATQGSTILENLHTLSGILNFRCTKEIVERIPNLKKLKIKYYSVDSKNSSIDSEKCSGYCLENLAYLHKLESLTLSIISFTWRWQELPLYEMFGLGAGGRMYIAFPDSLKKLSLEGGDIPWENATVIGSLPNLEVLKLLRHAFYGPEWNPEEGQFSRLKALYITESNLVWWRAESTHFPCLERLFLTDMAHLNEVPSDIGDIATLRSIYLERCSKSATISAKQIGIEQHNNGNELEVCAHWSNLPRWRIAFYAVLFIVRLTRALNHEDHWGESEYPSSPVESEYLSSPAESEFPYSESESGD
ncbi:UNVERIFIED_CONTAM: putative disease resistance RPP8-like protein 2 [Sesamum radiatum]|uniref:Disease resistance RPP8-like protein 2 n=1 Tax=Sesamum radiatum TaxID=300843 RepID=A0AAW2WGM5_SESRA